MDSSLLGKQAPELRCKVYHEALRQDQPIRLLELQMPSGLVIYPRTKNLPGIAAVCRAMRSEYHEGMISMSYGFLVIAATNNPDYALLFDKFDQFIGGGAIHHKIPVTFEMLSPSLGRLTDLANQPTLTDPLDTIKSKFLANPFRIAGVVAKFECVDEGTQTSSSHQDFTLVVWFGDFKGSFDEMRKVYDRLIAKKRRDKKAVQAGHVAALKKLRDGLEPLEARYLAA